VAAAGKDWAITVSMSPKRVLSAGIVNAPQGGKGLINSAFLS